MSDIGFSLGCFGILFGIFALIALQVAKRIWPEDKGEVEPHEFTPWLHPDAPCAYCGKYCGDDE